MAERDGLTDGVDNAAVGLLRTDERIRFEREPMRICSGTRVTDSGIRILPYGDFIDALWRGELTDG